MKNPALIGNAFSRPGGCVACIALLLVCLFPHAALAKGERVLLVSSYHPGFPTFFQQIKGLRSALEPADVLLDVEFMDTKRFSGTDNEAIFLEHLRFKLEKLPAYDAFVVADDAALRFALDHRGGVFAGKPLVFCGVNDQDLAHSLSGAPGVTGVIESISLRETLESMWQVIPGLKTVYALVDGEPGGQGDLRTYLAQRDFFVGKNLQVLGLDAMTWDELGGRLSILKRDEAILLLSAYRDRDNTTKSFEDSLKFILDHALVPVAHLWEHGLGQGILGGKLISHTEQGRIAGQLVLKILAGTPAASLPVVEGNEANRHVYDHAALVRFSIRESSLPPRSEIRGKPSTILSQYGTEIFVVLVFLITLLALVAALISHIFRLRRAQMRIAESEKRYKSLFDANADGILAVDTTDHHFVFANPSACLMFGYSKEEFCELSVRDILPPESLEEVFANFTIQANGQKDIAEALPCLRRDGSVFSADIRSFTLEADGTSYAVGLFRDVTERKAMERELVSVRDAALAASVAKSAFLATMSHEIRTPMNGVHGMLQLLADTNLDEEQKEYVYIANSALRNLLSLINDVLDFSRIEAEKLKIAETLFELDELCRSIPAIFKEQTMTKGLTLSIEMAPDAPTWIVGDPSRIRQVLLNLVGNAVKFTNQGSVTIRIQAETKTLPDNMIRLDFEIVDTGIGISPEILPHLFEPFTQGREGLVRSFQGTGLGLSIVKRLTRLMGGDVEITSTPGVGTTARFHVRVKPPHGKNTPAEADKTGGKIPKSGRGLRILLAEDDVTNMTMLTRMLEKMGCKVAQAGNGLEAVHAVEQTDVDLVLMDIQMPVMDGVEATKRIRSNMHIGDRARVPIIAVTAFAMSGDREKFLQAGMNDYLAKPLSVKTLVAAMDRAVPRGA